MWVFTALLFCGNSHAADAVAEQNEFQQLQRELEALRQLHNISVLAVSIAKDSTRVQTIVLGATPATPLRWGSITKTFTALTVLGMHEAGLVALDAPLARYVDETTWQNPWRESAPVRVIHLLELRAGFTDLSAQEFNYNEPMTLSQALQLNPQHRITRWPPGLQHGYSNMSPGLTQLLIERVSGMGYAAAVKKYVFDQLQMRDSGFEPVTNLPGGFKADGVTPIPYWNMTFAAFGALNAPMRDMNMLLTAAMMQQTLAPSVWDHLFQPHGRAIHDDFKFDYAAGFYPRVRQGYVWHGHGGDADGYRSRIALMRTHPHGYIANINTDNPRALKQIERLLEEYLTTDLPRAPLPQTTSVSRAELASLSGDYYPASARFGVAAWQAGQQPSASIMVRDDHLLFTRGERTTRLYPVTGSVFRRAQDPTGTVVFARSNEHMFLQGELGNFVRTDHCPGFLSTLAQCND